MFVSDKKRIKNIENILVGFNDNDELQFVLNDLNKHKNKLNAIGFDKIEDGLSILPKPIGSVSEFNANGKDIPLINKPKVSYSVTIERSWRDWHNNWYTRDIDFERFKYQRFIIQPPLIYLTIKTDKDNNLILTSPIIRKTIDNKDLIKHIANLFLELFEEFLLLDDKLLSKVKTVIKKLDWQLLPKGKYSWEDLEDLINKHKSFELSNSKTKEIYKRLNYINSFEPDFFALGKGGYNDYVVLGFEKKDIYVLENIKPYNATYIFKNNWDELSKLTKTEILSSNEEYKRLLHTKNWKIRIKEIIVQELQ